MAPWRRSTLTAVVALIAGLLIVLAPSPAQAYDRDCSDFATQRAAQTFFANHNPSTDPHRLDAEGDGIACESNPCPCSTRTQSDGDAATSTGQRTLRQQARVIKVVDGDTVDVRLANGRKKRVRLIGIDTPEIYGGTECGGPRASRSAKRMLPRGTRVRLISDSTQDRVDRYGRLLRYVVKANSGRDINRAQLGMGNATVYVYANNPFKRVAGYRRAQRDARADDRGIWRHCR